LQHLQIRFSAWIAAGVVIAFFLPWLAGAQPLTGLELVVLADARRQEQEEAILLVVFAAIPFTALLTLAAAMIRHGVKVLSHICGLLAIAGTVLIWLARQQAGEAETLGVGAYATGGLGLALILVWSKLFPGHT